MIFIFLGLFIVSWILAVVIFGGDPSPSKRAQRGIAKIAGWIGAVLGLLVSLVCMAVMYLFQRTPDAGEWLLWIWPSSLELMALEYNEAPLFVVLAFSIAIGFNAILYAGIAWWGAFIYSQIFRRTAQ